MSKSASSNFCSGAQARRRTQEDENPGLGIDNAGGVRCGGDAGPSHAGVPPARVVSGT